MPTEYAALGDHLDVASRSLEKEHVLLALHVKVDGRKGVLLCDPGYHVGRVVTVMADGVYPHTGRFVQEEEGGRTKEYEYRFVLGSERWVGWIVECWQPTVCP